MTMKNIQRNNTEEMIQQLTENNRTWWLGYAETLKESTRKAYQSDILNFLVWFGKDLTEVTAEIFEQFMLECIEKDMGSKVVNKKVSANSSMIDKYMIKNGYMKTNPLKDVKRLDETDSVNMRKPLTLDQVKHAKDLGGHLHNVFMVGYKGLSTEEAVNEIGGKYTLNKLQYDMGKLGNELNITNLKYSDLLETHKKYHNPCPCCGAMTEMSEGSWKFVDGMMVCSSC